MAYLASYDIQSKTKTNKLSSPSGYASDTYCGYMCDKKNTNQNYGLGKDPYVKKQKQESKKHVFIQICMFPIDKKNGKNRYNIRMYTYHGDKRNESYYRISEDAKNAIISKYNVNQYRLYQSKDFDTVPDPSIGNILESQSELLK